MGEDVKQFMSDSDEDPSSSEEDQEDHSSEESDSEDEWQNFVWTFFVFH